MKIKKWITAATVALTIGAYVPIASAQQTPPFVPNGTVPNQEGTAIAPRQQNQGQNPVQQVTGFLENLPQLLQGLVGSFKAPDLEELAGLFLGGSSSQTPGGDIAELIENQTPNNGSYSIRRDQKNEAIQTLGLSTMQQATLSKEAQDRATQIMAATENATSQNEQLGEESRGLDVSQQILQNISQQMALSGQVSQTLANEAQQARVDRAIGNSFAAQAAQETTSANIRNRRETTGAANSAVREAGRITLFGGGTVGEIE